MGKVQHMADHMQLQHRKLEFHIQVSHKLVLHKLELHTPVHHKLVLHMQVLRMSQMQAHLKLYHMACHMAKRMVIRKQVQGTGKELGRAQGLGKAQELGMDCILSKVRNQGKLGTQCKQGKLGIQHRVGKRGIQDKEGMEGREEQGFRQ